MPLKDLKSFSDEILIELVQLDHDHLAFTELYDRYWSKLLSVAYNLTRDKSAAKEIVQEVFVALWNRRQVVEIKNLNSYLATAVKFSVYKQFEKERRRRSIEVQNFAKDEQFALDARIESLFLKEYIANLLEALPEKCRLVVNYSRIEDLSNSQIAEKMNISEKTVEGHLTKGLKYLRNIFINSELISIILIVFNHHYPK